MRLWHKAINQGKDGGCQPWLSRWYLSLSPLSRPSSCSCTEWPAPRMPCPRRVCRAPCRPWWPRTRPRRRHRSGYPAPPPWSRNTPWPPSSREPPRPVLWPEIGEYWVTLVLCIKRFCLKSLFWNSVWICSEDILGNEYLMIWWVEMMGIPVACGVRICAV